MSKNTRLLTTPEQMASLSPKAREKLLVWCKEKDYGLSLPDGEFIPPTQLNIGMLIEFLTDQESGALLVKDVFKNWNGKDLVIDILFKAMQEILEQKN